LFDGALYGRAYGVASGLKEAKCFGSTSGRLQLSGAAGGNLAVILADMARQLGLDPAAPPPSVREGMEGALAQRPRWWGSEGGPHRPNLP
jgi:hypothetical protein